MSRTMPALTSLWWPSKAARMVFHQFAMGPFRNILGCRDQTNAGLLEQFLVVQILCGITEEAAEGVDDDHVHLIGRIAGEREHPLELRPLIGSSRQPRFNEYL